MTFFVAPSADRQPAVAVLLMGPYTGLNYSICALHRHLVLPLRDAGVDIHLFALVNDMLDPYTHTSLLRKLTGVQVHIKPTPPPRLPSDCRQYAQTNLIGRRADTFLASLHYKREADRHWRLVARQEGLRVDWVICLPANVLLMEPLPPLETLSPDSLNVPSWGPSEDGINDRLMIARPRPGAPYFKLYHLLCITNRPFPPKADAPMVYQWSADLLNFTFTRTVGLRFVTARTNAFLPMEQETPAVFSPEVLVCKNYRYIRIAWRVRMLQLECKDPDHLDAGQDALYPSPKCVWPSRKTMRGRNSTHILQHVRARLDIRGGFHGG